MGNTNLKRYFKIIELLEKEPNKWTCGKLGLYFGVSKQCIHRDINKLRNAGFDIKCSNKGYCLMQD